MENYIFDLYGTLIDVRTDEHSILTWIKWCHALNKRKIKHAPLMTMREQFFKMDKEYRTAKKAMNGSNYPEIDIIEVYRDMFSAYGNGILSDEVLNEISYEFRVASRKYIRLFPGVLEYLDKLKKNGKHAYILSNAQRSYTWPEIEMFGLDKATEDQLISSDYGVMKPDTEFFNALLDKYQMNREKTQMHGDSLGSDVNGAKSAGIGAVHLTGDNHPGRYYVEQVKSC